MRVPKLLLIAAATLATGFALQAGSVAPSSSGSLAEPIRSPTASRRTSSGSWASTRTLW